jgi:hypothetical protein
MVQVDDARQVYTGAIRQANLLSEDVDSYRHIVVTRLVSILFEGGAQLKQVPQIYHSTNVLYHDRGSCIPNLVGTVDASRSPDPVPHFFTEYPCAG